MNALSNRAYGSMSARIAPPLRLPEKPFYEVPLRDRIMKALASRSRTTSSIASELDVKELDVIRALANMAHEGIVVAGAVPASGRRDQTWGLK